MASTLRAAITRLSALAHRHTVRVWLLWGCGVLALVALPVALIDPPVLMLLLDPELLALIVAGVAGLIHIRPRQRKISNRPDRLVPSCAVTPVLAYADAGEAAVLTPPNLPEPAHRARRVPRNGDAATSQVIPGTEAEATIDRPRR